MGIIPPLPAVLGHEYCGGVEEVGKDVSGLRKGDRVVSPFCHGCGTCDFCRAGHRSPRDWRTSAAFLARSLSRRG